jgi:hypothetical protein
MRLGVMLLVVMVLAGTLCLTCFNFVQASGFSEIISSDTTWTKANGPYTLNGSVFVAIGATLTIEPGVIVNCQDFCLLINGNLDARGTSEDQIIFNGGQILLNSFGCTPKNGANCVIENALINSTLKIYTAAKINAVDCRNMIYVFATNGLPIISNSQITGGIATGRNSYPLITGNNISGQAIKIHSSHPTISNNDISSPISFDAFMYSNSSFLIENNLIHDLDVAITLADSNGQYGAAIIQNNTIINNNNAICISGYSGVIYCIVNNTISNNKNGVVYTQYYPAFSPIVQYNNLYGNTEFNIKSQVQNNIDVRNNWWGTTNTDVINQTICDIKNSPTLGPVNFMPFLFGPVTYVPPLDLTTSSNLTPAPSTTPTPINSTASSPKPLQTYNTSGFQIESNSTISEINYNGDKSALAFKVSGLSGTTGYTQISIPKSLSNSGNMTVTVDGKPVECGFTQTEDSWLLTFTYSHSTHNVMITLSTSDVSSLLLQSAIIIVIIGVAALVVVTEFRGEKNLKNKKSNDALFI